MNTLDAVSAGQVTHSGYAEIRSMMLKKDSATEIETGLLVALDTEGNPYVVLNSDTTYPIGVISRIESKQCVNKGVGQTDVSVSVLVSDRMDVVMKSADTFAVGDVVYAGANGIVSGTGTIPVGSVTAPTVSKQGLEEVEGNYFEMKLDLAAVNALKVNA